MRQPFPTFAVYLSIATQAWCKTTVAPAPHTEEQAPASRPFVTTKELDGTPVFADIGDRGHTPVAQGYRNDRSPLSWMLAISSRSRRERNSIMEISFIKSGGFAGAMTRVQGTIHLNDGPKVTGDSAYNRTLAPNESEAIRAGAEPSLLSQAASQISAKQAKGKGVGDLEHYAISVKTSDGKVHDVSLNTSGSSAEMEGVPPATAQFLRWLQQEAQKILTQKMTAK
jgi:hypothetical protein